jgi:spermidine synthase
MRFLLIGLLFFVSGFTGLLYEVIWAKYLALLLGSTAHAQVGVLAVFMAGLATGSAVWGRLVDRMPRALALYGALEVGIGICAAAFVCAFDALGHTYWSALGRVDNAGVAGAGVKIILCILSMFPPTFCMGGTLPVLSRALIAQRDGLGRGVAYLYAVNSIGAAIGAVVTGFFLVAAWGFDAPFYGAAAVNVGIGVLAIAAAWCTMDLRTPLSDVPPSTAPLGVPDAARSTEEIRGYPIVVLTGAAVCGAVAMIYEVAWIRLCSLILGSSTYSFSIILTSFISGIAAGSVVYALLDPARCRPLRFFGYSSLASAMTLLLCVTVYDRLPYVVGRLTALLRGRGVSFGVYQTVTLLFCIVVMLPLTFISGLSFPALTQAAARSWKGIGGAVSRVLVANTIGTIAGTIGAGLLLLPAIGVRGTFLFGSVLTAATALAVLACDTELMRGRMRAALALAAVAIAVWVACVPGWDLRLLAAGEFRRHEGIQTESFAAYRAGLEQAVVFYRDGASATVSVERQPPDEIVLRVNGKADATAVGDKDTQLLAGHLPAVLHPTARHALVIGYGSGMTVGALLQHPLQSIDVVEISPEVIAADAYFRMYNRDALHDGRTHLFVEDARTFLYGATGQYDLIISEPSNPWIAGIGNLFTREFFEQARSHLTPEGLLVQWCHTYETSDALVALILRTVAEGFGEVRVFQPNRSDVFVIASPARRAVSRTAMEEAFGHAGELQSIGIHRLATLLALEVLPDRLVRQVAGTGPVNRDRFPLLEYGAPRAFFDGKNAALLANVKVESFDGADFVQPTGVVGLAAYPEITGYLQRSGLIYYNQALRYVVAWLARAPHDPIALQALHTCIAARPNSLPLLHLLAHAAPEAEAAVSYDYAHLLISIVGSLRLAPEVREIDMIAPAVQGISTASAQGPQLLKELGDLYVRGRALPKALAAYDMAAPPSGAAGGIAAAAALSCARAAVLAHMSDPPAARDALAACVQADHDDLGAQPARQPVQASIPQAAP